MAGRKVLILANRAKDDAAGVSREMAAHLATLGVVEVEAHRTAAAGTVSFSACPVTK